MRLPRGFGGGAGSDMSTSYVFTQGVLAAITLMRGGAGDGGARTRASYDLGLLCLVANNLLGGVVRSQVAGAEALKFESELAPFLLRVHPPYSQHQNPCPRREQCWRKRGRCGCMVCIWAWAVLPGQSESGTTSDALPL